MLKQAKVTFVFTYCNFYYKNQLLFTLAYFCTYSDVNDELLKQSASGFQH